MNKRQIFATVCAVLLSIGIDGGAYAEPAAITSPKTKVEYLSSDLEGMLSPQMRAAIARVVINRNSQQVPGSVVTIISIRLEDNWGIATVISTRSPENQEKLIRDGGIMQPGLTGAVLFVNTETGWQAAMSETPEFESLLVYVPTEELSLRARAAFQGQVYVKDPGRDQIAGLKFPWRCTELWELSQGWHDDYYGSNALDYAPAGETTREVVSVTDATVIGLCNPNDGNFQVQVRTRTATGDDWYYLHLAKSDGYPGIGEALDQGEYVGKIVWDWNFSDSCGYGTGPHLHLTAPSRYYTMDGWTVSGGNIWTRPGYPDRTVGDTFESTNACGCCGCGKLKTASRQNPSFAPESFRGLSATSCTSASVSTAVQPVVAVPLPEPASIGQSAPAPLPTASPKPTATPQPVAMDEPLAPSSIPVHREAVEAQRTPPASENYRILKSIFGSGGGEKTSTSFVMNSTQGQSTDLNRRQSASYVLMPGYWSRWVPLIYDHVVYLPLILRSH